jgi:hypothetical protein
MVQGPERHAHVLGSHIHWLQATNREIQQHGEYGELQDAVGNQAPCCSPKLVESSG